MSMVPSSSSVWLRRLALTFSVVLGLGVTNAEAAIFKVGIGAACTHSTLESAVAAAAANGPTNDDIYLHTASLTLSAPVEVFDQAIRIFGGYTDGCTPVPLYEETVITFAGPGDAFWVHGGGATERHFDLYDISLQLGSGAGRGLKLEDNTQVVLGATEIGGGQATEGGNVWMSGSVELFLGSSRIVDGEATTGDGGGIYCEAGGWIRISDHSNIDNNTASHSGGGFFLDNCQLDFDGGEAPTDGHHGSIAGNKASTGQGGGIAAEGGADVTLRGMASGAPAYLVNNEATDPVSGAGGGLSLEGSGTEAHLWNSTVSGNTTGGPGGGVHVGSGAHFNMEADFTRCGLGKLCSILANNRSGGLPGGGLDIKLANAFVTRTSIYENRSMTSGDGAAIAVRGTGATLQLEGVLLYANDPGATGATEASRILVEAGSFATIAFTTIVEQTVAAGVGVFQVEPTATLEFFSSIVNASKTFEAPPPPANIHCIVTKEIASFPGGASVVTVVPDPTLIFRLSTPTDFALAHFSPAGDYCDSSHYVPFREDIDGFARGFDDPALGNIIGPFDLGADEWQPEVFGDGFEGAGFGRWSSTLP